jgi:hypothetical protein
MQRINYYSHGSSERRTMANVSNEKTSLMRAVSADEKVQEMTDAVEPCRKNARQEICHVFH